MQQHTQLLFSNRNSSMQAEVYGQPEAKVRRQHLSCFVNYCRGGDSITALASTLLGQSRHLLISSS